jgi:hypothetical protein
MNMQYESENVLIYIYENKYVGFYMLLPTLRDGRPS